MLLEDRRGDTRQSRHRGEGQTDDQDEGRALDALAFHTSGQLLAALPADPRPNRTGAAPDAAVPGEPPLLEGQLLELHDAVGEVVQHPDGEAGNLVEEAGELALADTSSSIGVSATTVAVRSPR